MKIAKYLNKQTTKKKKSIIYLLLNQKTVMNLTNLIIYLFLNLILKHKFQDITHLN